MDNNELYHYGVLGMKWGVRKNASNAYHKSLYKKRKLEDKASKYDVKSARYEMKALKRQAKATTPKKLSKAQKTQMKAVKYKLKSAKMARRGMKWQKAMEKTFSNYEIKRVPKETVNVGTGFTRGIVEKYALTPLPRVED